MEPLGGARLELYRAGMFIAWSASVVSTRVDRQTGGPPLGCNRLEFYGAGLLIVWSPNVEAKCVDRQADHCSVAAASASI